MHLIYGIWYQIMAFGNLGTPIDIPIGVNIFIRHEMSTYATKCQHMPLYANIYGNISYYILNPPPPPLGTPIDIPIGVNIFIRHEMPTYATICQHLWKYFLLNPPPPTPQHRTRGTWDPGNIGPGEHRTRATWDPGNIGPGEHRYAPVYHSVHHSSAPFVVWTRHNYASQVPTRQTGDWENPTPSYQIDTKPARSELRGKSLRTWMAWTGWTQTSFSQCLLSRPTRGHGQNMMKAFSWLESRKNVFNQWVVNDWNSIPTELVESPKLNTFKCKGFLFKNAITYMGTPRIYLSGLKT